MSAIFVVVSGDGRLNLDEARYFVAMIDTIGSSVPGRHPSEIQDSECQEPINGEPPVLGMTKDAFMKSGMPADMVAGLTTTVQKWRLGI